MKTKWSAFTTSSGHPSNSVIIQIGVAFIVVCGFALMAYSLQRFLP